MATDTEPNLADLPDLYEGTIDEIADTSAALDWVNELRQAHHQPALTELPVGTIRGDHCTIALALQDIWPNVWVTPFYIYPRNSNADIRITNPIDVATFIKRYDAGLYPELRVYERVYD